LIRRRPLIYDEHRHKHKKACDRRVAELHDKKLFEEPPSEYGDCPICFLRMPILSTGSEYYVCCGKVICSGCIHAPLYDNQGNKVDNKKCPFCRTPTPTSYEEIVKRTMKRVEANDARAMYNLGNYYQEEGTYGLTQDYNKALEHWHRAAELGNTAAHANLGYCYNNGEGVDIDKKKAHYHNDLAAMGGNVGARYNLGNHEARAGNYDRALKHYMIAASIGLSESLDAVKDFYSNGHATKEDYTNALRLYQEYLGEIKSKQRDEAAAFHEGYRYY